MVLNWLVQILLALKYLHDNKLLHRDLKPQNLFLTANGIVKLGDFGVAKILEGTGALAHTQIGTPFYLSPEICENKPYDAKSDMWSLGCVLYECLALRPPFTAKDMRGMVRAIMHSHAKPVSSVYSKDMRDLVAALLVKDPKGRPDVRQVLKLPFVRAAAEEMLGAAQAQSKSKEVPTTGIKPPVEISVKQPPPPTEVRPSERKRTPPKAVSRASERPRHVVEERPAAHPCYPRSRPHPRPHCRGRVVYNLEHQNPDQEAASKIQAMMRRSFRRSGERKAKEEAVEEAHAEMERRAAGADRPNYIDRAKSRQDSRRHRPRPKSQDEAASRIQSFLRDSLKRKAIERNKALVAERKKEIRREREGVFGAGVGDQQGVPMSQRDRRYQQRKADHSREAQLRR